MNQRNVEALVELLNEAPQEGDYLKSRSELQAEFLAANNVLALDVVTSEEWSRVGSNFSPEDILENIAKTGKG